MTHALWGTKSSARNTGLEDIFYKIYVLLS